MIIAADYETFLGLGLGLGAAIAVIGWGFTGSLKSEALSGILGLGVLAAAGVIGYAPFAENRELIRVGAADGRLSAERFVVFAPSDMLYMPAALTALGIMDTPATFASGANLDAVLAEAEGYTQRMRIVLNALPQPVHLTRVYNTDSPSDQLRDAIARRAAQNHVVLQPGASMPADIPTEFWTGCHQTPPDSAEFPGFDSIDNFHLWITDRPSEQCPAA